MRLLVARDRCRDMGMIATTLRAAWLHSVNQPKQATARFWLALKAILSKCSRMSGEHLTFAVRRYKSCQACELFDPKWKACGDGKTKLTSREFVGCLCYMPVKVTIPTATCWLHDQGIKDKGWPIEN